MFGRAFTLLLAALALPDVTFAQEEPSALSYRGRLSLGYHFSTGKYGASDSTEISYVPLVARADVGNWSLAVTVPYIRISGPSVVIDGVQTVDGEADGLGDISARTSYLLQPFYAWMPFIDLIGRIKFPTASRSDGLGTGEFDYGLEVELSKRIGPFTPFAVGGYRVLGSPPGSTLRNVAVASLGSTYSLTDSLPLGILLDYRDAASAASSTRLELVPFLAWKISPHWSIDFYTSAGLAQGSPDVGTGLQIAYSL